MNLMILTNTLVGGGAEKQLLLSVAGLAREGVRCTVFVLRPVAADTRYDQLIRNCQSAGARFYVPRSHADVLKVILRLAATSLKSPRGILWTWGFRAELVRLVCPWLWVPYGILALRSASHDEMQRHALLISLASPLTSLYIANSRRAIDLLCRIVPSAGQRSEIVYNSVERMASVNSLAGAMLARPRIVMLGNVRYYVKGYDIALRLAGILKSRKFDFEIVIGGRQLPGEPSIKGEIAAAGLSDVVRWAGPIVDVYQFLRSANIFLMLSRYEGTSNSLLEAMTAGLPCVSTAVGDVDWFVGKGAGISVVPIGDANAAADQIVRLCGDKVLAEGQGAKNAEFCDRHFSSQGMIAATMRALSRCRESDTQPI